MIDIHSHILPGIDDGAKNINDTIAIIRELAEQGVTDVIATPHYITETTFVSPRKVNLQLLEEVRQAVAKAGLNINVYLGNEVYISDNMPELVKKRLISTLADSRYILVELPLDMEFPNYEDFLLELNNRGLKVILAHPERYAIVKKDFNVARELFEAGILLQCNTGSILGQYGKDAKKTIIELAKRKMIFAFGSDIHRCRGRQEILMAQKKLKKYFNDREMQNVFVGNPKKILQGAA